MAAWEWDKEHEDEGYFWVAGSNDRFYGRLRHTANDGPGFHFYDVPGFAGRPRSAIPWEARIHGVLAGGRPVTLDPFYPSQTQSRGLPPTTTVDGFAGEVVVGEHVAEGQPLEADSISTTLHGLDAAIMGGRGQPGLLDPHKGSHKGMFSGGESREFMLPDGARLIFSAGESGAAGESGLRLEAHAFALVQASPATTTDDLEHAYLNPIREFVVFCTRSGSQVQTLSFARTSDPLSPIPVLRRPWPPPTSRKAGRTSLGLNLARVSDPDRVVADWFKLRSRVGGVWPSFFSTLSAEDLLESRFLSLMAFAEGYHRAVRDRPPLTQEQEDDAVNAVTDALKRQPASVRSIYRMRLQHINSQTQKERLEDLSADAKSVLGSRWPFEPRAEARSMVDTRNWMTHWGSKTKHVNDAPEALFSFCRQLELIGYVATLRDLELSKKEIGEAVAHRLASREPSAAMTKRRRLLAAWKKPALSD